MCHRVAGFFFWGLLAFSLMPAALSQEGQRISWPAPRYKVRIEKSVMVPMRDGVKLSTDLYFPDGAGDKLPVILIRTPYGKNRFRSATSIGSVDAAPTMFAGQGYIVAVQDTRGRFESEGNYTISVPDAEDGYDTTVWLATQPWSAGQVGTYGCSYLGDVQVMQARLRNPHLAAMIPQAAGSSVPERGFGVIYGGTVEVEAGFSWFWQYGSKFFLRPRPGAPEDFYAQFGSMYNPAPVLPPVSLAEIWKTLPLVDMMKKAGGPPTDWEDIVSHGPGDPYWKNLGYLLNTDRFDTPSLQVDSWYDFGTDTVLYQFNLMREKAVSAHGRDNQFTILSPTAHCRSESATEHTIVGQRDMGDARFGYYQLYLRWFDHWLKGVDNGVTEMPHLQIYVMGKNEWRGEQEWPLARTKFTRYYLHSGGNANSRFGEGTLSTVLPGTEPPDRYVYDPTAPVQSVGGPICCTGPEAPPGAFDQSDVEARQDVLVYSTPVLEKGIEVTGPIEAELYVSSSARDTDFTAKLVDVCPDGKAYNIQEGILRARYREGFDKQVWLTPEQVYELKVNMGATSNYFAPGHRIRLEISSSNFPRFDRNLNTGGRNYDEKEGVPARNTIHHSNMHASAIILPVIP